MIKRLKILGVLVLLFLVVQTIRMYYSGEKIPSYNYLGLDKKRHTDLELPKTPTIFIYFSPDCGFCEKAIIELKKLQNKNISYVFITNEKSQKTINDFIQLNKLNELTSLVFIDEKDSFPMDFRLGMTYTTPTILAYNKNGEFLKEITSYEDIKLLKFSE